MKKIINQKRYDTNTARLVGEYYSPGSTRDFEHYYEALYLKRTGEYFLHGEGGPASKYSKSIGQNEWSGSEDIQPLTEEQARKWAEIHLNADEYEELFEVIEDEPAGFTDRLGSVIQRLRHDKQITQSELAAAVGAHGHKEVSQWERGEVEPRLSRLLQIAEALGTTASAIIAEVEHGQD